MATFIEIKVYPSSGRNEWGMDESGIIKCYLKSPPEGGKANRELVMLIARLLRIPQYGIVIQQGLATRRKVVKIPGAITRELFLQYIGLE